MSLCGWKLAWWLRVVLSPDCFNLAGAVAFCGFQYLVVTKILMTSDPCEPFSLPNILLCVTLFLSTIAVFASGLFLCVDYLRRLAILTAQQKGCRLTLEARVMEKTGLGRAILVPYDSACRRARQDKTLEEFLQEQSGQTASWLPAWVAPGHQCRCSNGFNGSITWDGPEATGNCTAARCDVPHSNKEPGLSCECGDKYVGQISWSGSTALGTCEPAPCRGQKLNSLPGPDCQCTDGYTGQPTKHGDSLMDDGCEAAPCNIPNTTGDGPHCRCKDGFQGEINWEGVAHKIQWTLVESQPDGRCRWKLSGKEGHACGLDHSNDKIHQLFSSVAPAPPLECSIQVALPRCDLQFQYAITSHKASSYACRGEVGNMSPAPPQAPQALQFRDFSYSMKLFESGMSIVRRLGHEGAGRSSWKSESCMVMHSLVHWH
eukprot:g25698.t1